MSEVHALEGRVTRLENQITDGFNRLENLLRQEISELKADQITRQDKAIERLADDQRRLWDRLNAMELRENRQAGDHSGQHRVLGSLWVFVSAVAGGIITWLATWLTGGTPPHH